MSVFGVILVRIFPHSDWIRRDKTLFTQCIVKRFFDNRKVYFLEFYHLATDNKPFFTQSYSQRECRHQNNALGENRCRLCGKGFAQWKAQYVKYGLTDSVFTCEKDILFILAPTFLQVQLFFTFMIFWCFDLKKLNQSFFFQNYVGWKIKVLLIKREKYIQHFSKPIQIPMWFIRLKIFHQFECSKFWFWIFRHILCFLFFLCSCMIHHCRISYQIFW